MDNEARYESITNSFWNAKKHEDVTSYLRAIGEPTHVDSGVVQLMNPLGERDIICTAWYARLWCATHHGYRWEPLTMKQTNEQQQSI